MRDKNRIGEPIKDPLSSHALFELSLFSTCIFVFAALLMQFLLTLYTTILLNVFSISFQYRLFDINFLLHSNAKWSEFKAYFIFGSGPLILSLSGLALLSVLKKRITEGWKTKLALTWMAFLMVNALPCGIVAGVFFFDGFGIVIHWMTNSFIVRGMIALLVLMLLIIYNRFWKWLFLNASYNAAFLDNEDNQKIFIKNVYIRPWIYGLFILLFFNWPFNNWYWPAFLLSLGTLPVINQSLRYQIIYVMESENKIFTSRYQVLYIIIGLALIWVAGSIRINF